MAAPPNFWQQQQQQPGGLGMAGADASAAHAVPAVAAVAPADADEKLSTTWTHIVAVAGSEAKALDLMELLNGARREDTYQFPVPGVSVCLSAAEAHGRLLLLLLLWRATRYRWRA
jgi:hypothetical protein